MKTKDFELISDGEVNTISDKILGWIGTYGNANDFRFVIGNGNDTTTVTCLLHNRHVTDGAFSEGKSIIERMRGLLSTKFKAYEVIVSQTKGTPYVSGASTWVGIGNKTAYILSVVILVSVLVYFYFKRGELVKVKPKFSLGRDVEMGGISGRATSSSSAFGERGAHKAGISGFCNTEVPGKTKG